MSTPDWAAVGTSSVPSDDPVIPDHTKSRSDKPLKERFESALDRTKLGANKAARSPVRKLTEDDRKKIADFYAGAALMFVVPINPLYNEDAAAALAEQADACADAWMRLAENNDTVRRMVLVFVEGGAWGALVSAHVPIAMAFLPEATKRNLAVLFKRPEVPDTPEGI